MDINETTTQSGQPKPRRARRIGAIAGAGLFAGLVAAAIGGVAAAQPVDLQGLAQPVPVVAQVEGADTDTDTGAESLADIALWEQFEECLNDAGIAEEAFDTGVEIDEATIDAAFEACESVLDHISDDFDSFLPISDEDEAVFEQFDACLSENGVAADAFDTGADIDEDALDAAFEACDPILDDLSDDFDMFDEVFEDGFGDLSPQDEAVFERYDSCLEDAGLTEDAFDDEAAVDEAAIDAAFESCDPILDELSEEAQALFGDCPDEDEGDHASDDEDGEA